MLPSQKPLIKPCFVSLDKDLVDDHLKTIQKDQKFKKKCVVFLDKDSIIESHAQNTIRAQSTPHERHSIIKNSTFMKAASTERNTPGRKNAYYPVSEPSTPLFEPALSSELRRAIDEKNLFTTKTKKKFMSALSELEEANDEENRKRYKKKAINEVVASETAYIKQLELIFNYFEKPIRERGLLSKSNHELVFGGLKSIYKLNKELMQMLELNKMDVGSAFLKIAPFFKLYSTYAYEFKDILEIIEKSEENNEFNKFIENQESRPEVQSKLSALLITPIQRVPRYCLLLKQILDHSKETEDDYDDIKQSLNEVEKSAKHIDTLVEQKENSIRLVEIQTALIDQKPIIIKPGRFLIHEGHVLKIVSSSVCPIYLILLNDIILFCKTKKKSVKTKNSLKCETIYPLASCKIVEKVVSRNIHISCENENIMIFIEKPKEFNKWITILKDAQIKAVLNRMTLRKESSLRKPAHYKNLSQYNEVDLSPCVPQRKRQLHETDSMRNETSLFHKFEQESVESPLKKFCGEKTSKKDSLFPLRSHLLSRNPIGHKKNPSTSNIKESLKVEDPTNVYVFGEPSNVNRGFNFSFTNFFSSIGNSLKRFFRYK